MTYGDVTFSERATSSGTSASNPLYPVDCGQLPNINPNKHVSTSNTVFIQIFVGSARDQFRCRFCAGAEAETLSYSDTRRRSARYGQDPDSTCATAHHGD